MLEQIIKNPIIIALVSSIILFVFLYWKTKNDTTLNPDNKKNKHIKNGIICAALAIIIWFIGTSYLDTTPSLKDEIIATHNPKSPISISKGGSDNYHHIAKNTIITPPNDVFLDIMPF